MTPTSIPLNVEPWLAYTAAYLTNYALHSTLLLAAVWLAVRFARPAPGLAETLWKTALVAGVVTAGWQTLGLGAEPLGGRAQLTAPFSDVWLAAEPADDAMEYSWQVAPASAATASDAVQFTFAASPWPAEPVAEPVVSVPIAPDTRSRLDWLVLGLLGMWAAGAGFFLVKLGVARLRLWRWLRDRRPLGEHPLAVMLDRLRQDSGLRRPVRLSLSEKIGGPLAIGDNEICVPQRVLDELTGEQQESVLAHELAHLIRGDNRWRLWAAALGAVFFFQPLNRVARREVNECAEYLCDDWAVRRTGRDLTLARCLVEVAGWMRPARDLGAHAAMADSPLVRRVERLVAGGAGSPQTSAARRVMSAAALIALVCAVSPVVSAGDFGLSEPAPVPEAPEPPALMSDGVPPAPLVPRAAVRLDCSHAPCGEGQTRPRVAVTAPRVVVVPSPVLSVPRVPVAPQPPSPVELERMVEAEMRRVEEHLSALPLLAGGGFDNEDLRALEARLGRVAEHLARMERELESARRLLKATRGGQRHLHHLEREHLQHLHRHEQHDRHRHEHEQHRLRNEQEQQRLHQEHQQEQQRLHREQQQQQQRLHQDREQRRHVLREVRKKQETRRGVRHAGTLLHDWI